MLNWVGVILGVFTLMHLSNAVQFELRDKQGEFTDVICDGKVIARYMYAYDASTPERLRETYKPYLHIIDPKVGLPITKGPGGMHPHHRAIFVGWSRTIVEGKRFDFWSMRGTHQLHLKFTKLEAKGNEAVISALIAWKDANNRTVIEEERTMRFLPPPNGAIALVDLVTTIKPAVSDVRLDGDPEHAGVQFRAASDIVAKETVFIFPKEDADPKVDRDYQWVAMSYTLPSGRYTVVHMNHPSNPKGTIYSAYRDYGRFGAFPRLDVKFNEFVTLKYRIVVFYGDMPDASLVQKLWDEFARVSTPSPAPKLTVRKGMPQ
ncbi:MAG: DUF6807 family protein [Armatimonadota bacterium]|nr:PmoA family protein [Armatimonadota bacterium]MCX7778494.1 PmoA family protein [Armatimonadota bacterium]MDW8025620.1 DUF6807 family protein [Armatimonadota bacterium]